MSKASPTSLSMDFLNKCGMCCWVVEKWNAFAKVRQDAFGFADILAYGVPAGLVLVQTTTASNFAARRKKLLANPHVYGWKKAGGRVLLHGWGKNGLRSEEL